MTGFTDYFTATSMFAAHQARLDAVVPWLEAHTDDGKWTRCPTTSGSLPGSIER